MRTDVCIIGAGPGGLSAAIHLAKRGIRSIVIEKSVFPRHKACGDILTSNVLREVQQLDVEWAQELIASDFAHEVVSTNFASGKIQKGTEVDLPLEMVYHSPSNEKLGLPSCLSARRIDFDQFLMEKAKSFSDIQIMEGCSVSEIKQTPSHIEVTAEEQKFKIEANILLMAAGANSSLTRHLTGGLESSPKHTALGIRTYFKNADAFEDGKKAEYYLFEQKLFPGGLYVTPLGKDLVNVNIVMRQDVVQREKVNLRQQTEYFLENHPELKHRFKNASQEGVYQGSTLYLGTRRRKISGDRFLLIGDAAGLTDATNANGIGHAMTSGRMAADVTEIAISKNDYSSAVLKSYDQAIYKKMSNTLLPGKIMTWMFANQLFSKLSSSLIHASFKRLNPKAVQEFVYAKSTARLLLNPFFYIRLMGGNRG